MNYRYCFYGAFDTVTYMYARARAARASSQAHRDATTSKHKLELRAATELGQASEGELIGLGLDGHHPTQANDSAPHS